jgi:hypothetical protein
VPGDGLLCNILLCGELSNGVFKDGSDQRLPTTSSGVSGYNQLVGC